jgi:hypothetical protein
MPIRKIANPMAYATFAVGKKKRDSNTAKATPKTHLIRKI